MRIAFCVYEWAADKLPLQPWLTLREVGSRLVARGHSVHVLTDCSEPAQVEGMEAHSLGTLRGTQSGKVRDTLLRLAPEALVMLPTPLNIVSSSWLDGLPGCRRIGFASYPFYTPAELLRAARCLPWRDVRQYLRNLLIPGALWRRAMRRRLEVVIAQSQTTVDRLAAGSEAATHCHWVPPGINLQDWSPADAAPDAGGATQLLYLGAATAIRGFEVALEAMTRLTDVPVRLRILARGADAAALARIHAAIDRRRLAGHVDVEGGWIDPSRLAAEIRAADAVLLPFVLVPSELPVSVMETIACGTPVIGSDIDGLPSTIGSAGAVARQGDAGALAAVIAGMVGDEGVARRWREACRRQREQMVGWEAVTDRWEGILAHD